MSSIGIWRPDMTKSECRMTIRHKLKELARFRHPSLVLRYFSRVPQDFLDSSVASEDAAQTVLTQCYHSKLHSFLL
jgi:hypothetical protein